MREISFEVRTFLKDQIQSAWQLDLLVALINLNRPVDANTLSKMLYSSQPAVESALQKFQLAGIVREIVGKPSTFVFSPRSEEKENVIKAAVKAYSIRRVDVINMIFSNPSRQTG